MNAPGPSRASSTVGTSSTTRGKAEADGNDIAMADASSNGGTNGIAESDSATPEGNMTNGKGKHKEQLTVDQEIELENAFLRAEPDDNDEVLITTIKTSITNCSNFSGRRHVTLNTHPYLRRDKQSIVSYTIEARLDESGAKIGLLAKHASKGLAPLIDSDLVYAVADFETLPANLALADDLPIKVRIYGSKKIGLDKRMDFAFPAREKKKQTQAQAIEERKKAESAKMSRTTSEVDEAQQQQDEELISATLEQETNVNGRRRDVISEMFKAGSVDPAQLPVHPCPPGRKDGSMRTDLLHFQRQGLAWMIRMEHPQLPKTPQDPPVQLWKAMNDAKGEKFWYNIATKDRQRDKPKLKRGGILADEMGLGKTMQTIALICTDDTGEGVLEDPEDPDDRYDDMTLIVCPLSVLSNWDTQLKAHVGSKRMQWHIYHGEGRSLTKKQLRDFDVVITTYQAVASELAPSRGSRAQSGESDPKKVKRDDTLHHISWRRVVLDEGHVIKNRTSQMYQGCITLKAERKWILTGTPIINSAADLGAMITFTRLCRPLDDAVQWKHWVGDGKRQTEEVADILRAVVSSTTLRRTKDMSDAKGQPLVKLPKIQFFKHKVQLKPDARKLYDEIRDMSEAIVDAWVEEKGNGQRYTALLVIALRLRQLACNPSLCPESYLESVRSLKVKNKLGSLFENLNTHVIAEELKGELRRAVSKGLPCAKCGNLPDEAASTFCKHIFCFSCIERVIQKYSSCPVCALPITSTDELVLSGTSSDAASESDTTVEAEVQEQQKTHGPKLESAKTEELIRILNNTPKGVKSLVFSQWITHLNCIEPALNQAGIRTCRFEGSMSQAKRSELIKSFQSPIDINKKYKKGQTPPTVMLISLKAGALGLNLTSASQVFLMDPWWQASIEQQAIDRVFRIGQTNDVRVFQLIAEDTVEDKVLEIQDQKDKLIAQAFSGNKQGAKSSNKIESKMDDILSILNMKA
ncbi:hypothetical protein OIO90_003737 [Microbotryomycetes sp. JL221]|nr:hypothetical protein OIO90_003737 [Microbotryomycetes sp. JL221]